MSDVKLTINTSTGAHAYTLSPGVSVTRTLTKEIYTIPKPVGKPIFTSTYRIASDTFRVDCRCATTTCTGGPSTVDHDALANNITAESNNDALATLEWGGHTYSGRVRSITVSQRSGEGELFDLSVIFEAGAKAG